MSKSDEDSEVKKLRKLLKKAEIKAQLLEAEKSQIEAEKSQIEAEKSQIEAKNLEIEKIQKIQNEGKIFLKTILNGVPEMTFSKFNRSETDMKSNKPKKHTSNHPEIKKIILSEYIPKKLKNINLEKLEIITSKFFDKNSMHKNKVVSFSSESTIQRLVFDYMTDIFSIMDLENYVNCYETTNITAAVNEKGGKKKNNFSDVTIIKTVQNKPITVLEIKTPPEKDEFKDKDNVLNNKNVIGQIYDYMLGTKSFYNQKKVFGILTNLKEWRFLWLPEDENHDFNKRIVHITKIYKFSDPDLAKIIINIIQESLDSEHYFIKIFDKKRNYIEYSNKGCRWKRMDTKEISNISKNINLDIYSKISGKEEISTSKKDETNKNIKDKITIKPYIKGKIIKDETTFTIFKFFQTGKYAQTSLIITDCGSIGVLKQFFGEEKDLKKFTKEASKWKKIYGIDIELKIINTRPTFIMPLVFTLESRKNKIYDTEEIFFQLNLQKIFTYHGVKPDELPMCLQSLQKKLNNYSFDVDVEKSIVQAINLFAEKKYVHNDFEWRHVGLLPKLDKSGDIDSLEPILIDLEYVKKEKNIETAREIMLQKFKSMSKKSKFIKEFYDEENYY